MPARYARVVVDVRPAHLDRPFDYRVPEGARVTIGQRVRVAFAGRRRTGWVVGVADETDADPARVRDLALIQGPTVWFDEDDLALYRWVAERWAGTLADVLRHALPPRVADVDRQAAGWPPPESSSDEPGAAAAPLPDEEAPADLGLWSAYEGADVLLDAVRRPGRRGPAPAFWWRPLADADHGACAGWLVEQALTAGAGVLALAPSPAAPVLDAVRAAGERVGAAVVDWREATTDRARHRAHLRGRLGHARVVVGERGAVFAPVPALGLVLVDDEASPAYKERRSPRFHARDVALARARRAGAATVLVGDLPSAAAWRLLDEGHVSRLRAPRPLETERAPRVDVIDRNELPNRRGRLARPLDRALRDTVAAGGAAVVLAARGGEGAALACTGCGQRRACPVCAGSLRPEAAGKPGGVHRPGGEPVHRCPTCGWSAPAPACAACGDRRTAPLAAGAARLAAEIARAHPTAEVVRMEGFDAPGPSRRPGIGVMTRGSVVDRPRWLRDAHATALVIPDADAMAGRADLEAGEDALRLWMAAARVADRVVVQTAEPRAAAIQALVRSDPDGFWRREAVRRAELGFPPARSLVRIQPDDLADAPGVAAEVREALRSSGADALGPDDAGALLVKTPALRGTLRLLRPLQEAWGRDDRGVRVDVDPVPAG